MPDLSVIMPVYNGETYLRQVIDSILKQSFRDFEFIIIDNASTNGSEKVIHSYEDSRIKLIQNANSQRKYPSRNKGLEIATGKYICVMDADEIRKKYQIGFVNRYKSVVQSTPDELYNSNFFR